MVNTLPIGVTAAMEPTTYLEHYRIVTGESGREVSRTGAAINYKAIDTRTHETVRLQLIPLATIDPEKREQLKERAETAVKLDHVNIAKTFATGVDHDYFVIVSEHIEGETADSWIVENGPMATDAALHVGLQVVRALGAAAYFNLIHRAIQPSNLIIAPGEAPDGGWPFVKLLNFGLASLELHSESTEAQEIAPTVSPQFASPEQRANGEIDFRSEMYSLGATMCFLLTGAAPLAVSGMKARLRIQRLPELRRAPKPLHNLLVSLLREDPANRPQDPVLLEKEMRDCLNKIERRQAIGRKLGISLAAVVPRKVKEKRPANPAIQVLGGFAAVAILLLAAAASAEYFFPDKIPYFHRNDKVGKQIGVPDASKFASAPAASANPAPVVAANQPTQNGPAENAEANENPAADAQQNQRENAPATTPVVASNQTSKQQTEPPSPAYGPSEPSQSATTAAAQEDSGQPADTDATELTAEANRRDTESLSSEKQNDTAETSTRRSTSQTAARHRDSSIDQSEEPRARSRSHHAEVLGYTANGGLRVRLSNGETIVLPPLNNRDKYRPRHRIYTQRPDDFIPPSQPFNQNN
jgi:serine/threonine protein kinase